MIAKTHRLHDREVKKVLRMRKGVFSDTFVANTLTSREGRPRFAIMLSGKHTHGSVNRNFWRRAFYRLCSEYTHLSLSLDIVFMAKKGVLLDHKNPAQYTQICSEISSLLRKVSQNPVIDRGVSRDHSTRKNSPKR